MATEVSSNVIEHLLSEARRAHPLECCGILLGRGEGIVQARATANVHPDPRQHFEIDPQACNAWGGTDFRSPPKIWGGTDFGCDFPPPK